MVATGFNVKSQIPLNPHLLKGNFKPPFEKGGQGGFFVAGGEPQLAYGLFNLRRRRQDADAAT